jgi:hypothetical protein
VTQLALGGALLVVTFAVVARYTQLNQVDPGFDASDVLTATIPVRGMRYADPGARSRLTSQLLERVRAIPGVRHGAVASLMPLAGGLMSSPYAIPGRAVDSTATAAVRSVSSDFFATLRIPIRAGRAIEATDGAASVAVAVVNEAFARQALGGGAAVGASIAITPPGSESPREFHVVGVAGNAKERDLLGADSPIIYLSSAQASFPHMVLAVRWEGRPPVSEIRSALRALDPALALDDVSALTSRVRGTFALQYFLLNILGAFAVAASLLIAVGVYGLVSYTVAADVRALAIRMALGATRPQLLRSVVWRTGRWASLGVGVGALLGAIVLWSSEGTMAHGIAGSVIGPLVELLVALGAIWIPAWRASGIEPLKILRSE